MINLEAKICIVELAAWMDGGSLTLECINSLDEKYEITLVQNASWDWYHKDLKRPGRIYLNDNLIEQRSDVEVKILNLLSNASLKDESNSDREMLIEKLNYINSDSYLTDQNKIILLERNQ